MPQEKWIILMSLGREAVPAWFTEEAPVLYDTQKEAVEKMLENFIYNISMQLEQVKDGAREPDDVDTENDEFVEQCTLHEDGVLTQSTEQGSVWELYNPKTYVR